MSFEEVRNMSNDGFQNRFETKVPMAARTTNVEECNTASAAAEEQNLSMVGKGDEANAA